MQRINNYEFNSAFEYLDLSQILRRIFTSNDYRYLSFSIQTIDDTYMQKCDENGITFFKDNLNSKELKIIFKINDVITEFHFTIPNDNDDFNSTVIFKEINFFYAKNVKAINICLCRLLPLQRIEARALVRWRTCNIS